MLKNVIKFLVVVISFASLAAIGDAKSKSVTVDLDKAILITDVIMPETMKLRIKQLIELQKQDTDVDIVINSPGGEVYSTLMFISVMEQIKASGKQIRCIVLNGAASAAFQILSHCSQRITMEHSFLLWHPVRVGLGFMPQLTPAEARSIANHLNYLEGILISDLRQSLHVSDDDFYTHYNLETLHTGASLSELAPDFLKLVGFVSNLKEVRDAAEAQHKSDEKEVGFMGLGQDSPVQFNYITTSPNIPDLIQ